MKARERGETEKAAGLSRGGGEKNQNQPPPGRPASRDREDDPSLPPPGAGAGAGPKGGPKGPTGPKDPGGVLKERREFAPAPGTPAAPPPNLTTPWTSWTSRRPLPGAETDASRDIEPAGLPPTPTLAPAPEREPPEPEPFPGAEPFRVGPPGARRAARRARARADRDRVGGPRGSRRRKSMIPEPPPEELRARASAGASDARGPSGSGSGSGSRAASPRSRRPPRETYAGGEGARRLWTTAPTTSRAPYPPRVGEDGVHESRRVRRRSAEARARPPRLGGEGSSRLPPADATAADDARQGGRRKLRRRPR